MNSLLIRFIFFGLLSFSGSYHNEIGLVNKSVQAENLIIITADGFRWQELYNGADSALINNEKYTHDTATLKALYWSADKDERRKLLMPFCWNIIAKNGQLYGNRTAGNKVNTSNFYSGSYPGYNELFTGTTDLRIYKNQKKYNANINVLEFINKQDSFAGKVVVFASWEFFPFILNQPRNQLTINSGYTRIEDTVLNAVSDIIQEDKPTRHDRLTFMAAKSWLEKNQPRVLLLALGETDEFAHSSRYDLYLQQIHETDAMISELWHWVQTTEGYKDNTNFIITTDHGRGSGSSNWNVHGVLIRGSSETWMACLGPGVEPLGEVRKKQQIYAKQLPTFMASLLGINFKSNR
jgi:hypothetical protein